jgi:hypothetical protein
MLRWSHTSVESRRQQAAQMTCVLAADSCPKPAYLTFGRSINLEVGS